MQILSFKLELFIQKRRIYLRYSVHQHHKDQFSLSTSALIRRLRRLGLTLVFRNHNDFLSISFLATISKRFQRVCKWKTFIYILSFNNSIIFVNCSYIFYFTDCIIIQISYNWINHLQNTFLMQNKILLAFFSMFFFTSKWILITLFRTINLIYT